MKITFGFAILAILIPGGWMACKSLEELDACVYEVTFLENRDIAVPTSDGEVIAQCDKAKAGITCLKDYATECLTDPTKSITLKILNDLQNHLNTRCDSAPHRADFLKHIACFVDPAKAEAVRFCSDKHLVMIEKVSNLPKELRLGGGCCSAVGFQQCVMGKITELCTGETGDYFNDMIQEVAEENMQLVCSEYSNMDQCNSRYDAATWADLKGILNSNDPNIAKGHKYKTVIPSVIKMMQDGMK